MLTPESFRGLVTFWCAEYGSGGEGIEDLTSLEYGQGYFLYSEVGLCAWYSNFLWQY
jgi:hypothetical protein